ncbi:hypothetical protein QPK87_19150 [Kamptonema cortianum]|nr:hypothetical protein [Geitlerinema splendidum]MDK3158673.1 hypothetical protein [Kamptonema cortianum]
MVLRCQGRAAVDDQGRRQVGRPSDNEEVSDGDRCERGFDPADV